MRSLPILMLLGATLAGPSPLPGGPACSPNSPRQAAATSAPGCCAGRGQCARPLSTTILAHLPRPERA